MNYGSRRWIKLWVDPWLSSTMRFTLSHKQRAVWADLLALGGQSRIAGVICAGEEGGKIIGFPLSRIAGSVDVPDLEELKAMLDLFAKQERITVEYENGRVIIHLLNWSKYQAEYKKQARYKAKKKQERESGYPHGYQKATPEVTGGGYQKATSLEVEVEVEGKHIRPSDVVKPAVSRGGVSPETDPEHLHVVAEVWEYYLQKLEKNPRVNSFTAKREKRGLARLGDALAMAGGDPAKAKGLMMVAVDTLAASPFHRGDNDRKRRYDSWEDNLFDSKERFEKWLQQSIDSGEAE